MLTLKRPPIQIMPKISERQNLLKQFQQITFFSAIFDDNEVAEEFCEYEALLLSHRFMSFKTSIPKTIELRNLLWEYSETEFEQTVRVNRDTFTFIVLKITDHPVFQNNSRNTQREVWIQALVALEKLGCEGNGASVGRIARSAGIGNGTVTLYTSRFVTAILDLRKEFIKWPGRRERQRIAARFQNQYHLPNAVGIVDGTHIHFSQKPAVDGEVYWTRKSRYSLNAQIVSFFPATTGPLAALPVIRSKLFFFSNQLIIANFCAWDVFGPRPMKRNKARNKAPNLELYKIALFEKKKRKNGGKETL